MAFSSSPLFTVATATIRADMRRRFEHSDYGQLLKQLESARRNPLTEEKIGKILRKFSAATPERTIHQLMGTDFASLVRSVERYARGPGAGGIGKRLLSRFLASLGPSGNLLRSLSLATKAPAGYRSSLQAAMDFIRSMGGEVIPGKEWGTVEDVDRAVKAMERRMAEMRARGEQIEERPATAAKQVTRVDMAGGGGRKFPPNHPIVTGDMVPTPGSSNVYEFGYDADISCLYVRFKRAAPPGEKERPNAPGALYSYRNVTPEEFLGLYRLRNHAGGGGGPGDWVWDHLRVRGTVSGHQKDYQLVGIVGGYVPRKATVEREGDRLVEYFVPRVVKTTEGKWLRSRLKRELAPTTGFMVGERGAGAGPRGGRNNPRG
jgi:hypothetical protein